ncbi:hypothetical protein BJ322DRAFT_1024733 [Thelephora terrestris]|uniref:Uncharacterized protein n=1 Tax=Thelephora terrestris TaxID=56493 RepID=A0A9P6H4M0_9AGAM|nr:hypothetical protein BJ322DRAFT_1024733 [Thelephora terrestris]
MHRGGVGRYREYRNIAKHRETSRSIPRERDVGNVTDEYSREWRHVTVDVNGLTDLMLLLVQRAAEAVCLVAQLTERVEGWSVQRTLDQTMVDSARNRLRAEVQLAVAHRLEEARVVEMVDEEVVESASEGTEEEVASAEEYWQTWS